MDKYIRRSEQFGEFALTLDTPFDKDDKFQLTIVASRWMETFSMNDAELESLIYTLRSGKARSS